MSDYEKLLRHRSKVYDRLQACRIERKKAQDALNKLAEKLTQATFELKSVQEKEASVEDAFSRAHSNVVNHPEYTGERIVQ